MKKLGILLATVIMIMLFAVSASAATEGYYTYYVSADGEATITGVDKSISGDVTIPSTLGGYNVTAINYSAFKECDNLTSVIIPGSVVEIGYEAFYSCTNLTNIIIPNSVTSIGGSAFLGCDNLTSVIIPDSVITIGDWAFSNCDYLASVIIPDSVVTIGNYTFFNCNRLESIVVNEDNENYCSVDGVLFDKAKETLIQYPIGNNRDSYSIPDGVITIEKRSFSFCDYLKSVIIPDGVIIIGMEAFDDCSNLASVIIPDSVTTIEHAAFASCAKLTNVTIPDSVITIDGWVFAHCISLASVIISDGVITIGENAFNNCVFTSVTIPDSVVTIGERAFYNCYNLTSVTIPDSVKEIGEGPFAECDNLTSIVVNEDNENYCSIDGILFDKAKETLIQYPEKKNGSSYSIPDSVVTIGDYAFYSCDYLNNVIIPDSVTEIGEDAFAYCRRFTKIIIPDSITTIGSGAFSGCNNLTNIIIPNSVTTIGRYAFLGCDNLTDVYFCGTKYQWENITISNNEKLTTVTIHFEYCPENLDNCHIYVSDITIQPTHTSEGVEAFICNCGYSYTEPVAKIPHAYSKVITAPTCTEDGYTTYTCECGDSYKGDIVNKTGHSHTSVVTRPATHLVEGIRTYTCTVCSHSYTDAIAKTTDHSYAVSKVVKPTCEDKGYTVYACECGSTKNDNYTDKTGHNYDGQPCTTCGKKCSCNCHKSGFMGFIWKITLFFSKLFKTKKMCACGISHY